VLAFFSWHVWLYESTVMESTEMESTVMLALADFF
jgi:hypothetical protein